jgi:predicted ATPase
VAISIEIKNCRCFPEPSRATFLLDRGVTALVGKNNAGKSALLKFFYELRDVFRNLGQQPLQFAAPENRSVTGFPEPRRAHATTTQHQGALCGMS